MVGLQGINLYVCLLRQLDAIISVHFYSILTHRGFMQHFFRKPLKWVIIIYGRGGGKYLGKWDGVISFTTTVGHPQISFNPYQTRMISVTPLSIPPPPIRPANIAIYMWVWFTNSHYMIYNLYYWHIYYL